MKIFTKGKIPRLLILSGMHGDEYEVTGSVIRTLKKYWKKLPDFICVPEVSPSALTQRTRKNSDKVDLNRSFFKNTKVGEAVQLMNLVKKYDFEICWDFHEDPDLSEFYMYDSGNMLGDENWEYFTDELEKLEIKLYSGIDDATDADLGFQITDGYISIPHDNRSKTGMFSEWALEEGIIQRYINPETPGKIALNRKNQIVDLIFRSFLLRDSE